MFTRRTPLTWEKVFTRITGVTLKESRSPIGKVTVQGIFERSLNGITELVYEHYRQQPEKFVNRWYAMG